MIKKIIKLIIPGKIIFLIKTFLVYWSDIKRYTKHTNTYFRADNPNKIKGHLTILYHIVEKGLTMPETRLGFGTKIIFDLIDLCNLYILNNYDTKDPVFDHSVKVLNEYLRFHELNRYSIGINIIEKVKNISFAANINTYSNQKEFSNIEFFKDHQSSFDKFCKSRHTSRSFVKKNVPVNIINKCIELANESPSACNRQPTRVYIIRNRQKITGILELQNGNRGFGHLADFLLVITSDISVLQSMNERNEPFFNSGLFSMTLIYALHFYEIGACLLNWSSSDTNDCKLRTLIEIPDNEVITVIIACGYLPDKFKIASSPRLKIAEITHEII